MGAAPPNRPLPQARRFQQCRKPPMMAQTCKITRQTCVQLSQTRGLAMPDNDWKIALVVRTIGAERGRAARGRPLGLAPV